MTRFGSGWEYDILALLPDGDAARVRQRAYREATAAALRAWWGWVLVPLACGSFGACWVLLGWAGLGLGARLGADVAFHALVAAAVKRMMYPLFRRCLRDELRDYLGRPDADPAVLASAREKLAAPRN